METVCLALQRVCKTLQDKRLVTVNERMAECTRSE